MKHFDDIQDDEIRLITPKGGHKFNVFRRWWFWVVVSICTITIILLIVLHLSRNNSTPEQQYVPTPVSPNIVEDRLPCVILSDTTINDIKLIIYTPQNAKPELRVGIIDTTDQEIVLAFQAADIRADNNRIVGDFVLNGKKMSNGKSKKGCCAIIGGKIYIDNNEDSPLFDEAIEKQGYFFRQYPLVINGDMQENKPKGKSVRHALCEKDGVIMTISTSSQESFHDFAQALSDLGVQQAIYLSGGSSYGFCRTETNSFSWGDYLLWDKYTESVNYIVWKAVNE